MELNDAKEIFIKIYGDLENASYFHSPGRINLIGEHTDYNGGAVFPCALSFGTYGIARKRNDNTFNFASTNFDLRVSCNINDLEYKKEHDWANFLKGIIKEFIKLGKNIGGLDILISGNIPNGSGLSSSASIELLMSVMLNNIFDCKVDMIEMVKLSQRCENQYIGVNCGIMDQFAIGMGKKNNAMLLNCTTLDYTYIPVNLKNTKIIISNTNKRRELAESKYNERFSQCQEAVALLNKELNISLLAELSVEKFNQYKHLITDEIILKRATHVVTEIERTLLAADYLRDNNLIAFGKLLNASHDSLKDLYEVTGIELDTLVDEARKIKGTLGSRMTGAGFGGCTISLVETDFIDEFIKTVGDNYTKKIGYSPSFYIADVGDGAMEIID